MESCLRAARQGSLTLNSTNFEVLVDGVRMLEHVIAARRTSVPPPSVDAMVEKLEALGQTGEERSLADSPAATDARTAGSGNAQARLWRVTFVPSG